MTQVWGTAGDQPIGRLSAWDTVFVAGVALPGLARVSGKGVEHTIDVKKSPGKDGATFTDLGRELAHFSIVLVLQSQEEWDAFETSRSTLQPLNATGKLQALSVAHPVINVLGVRSLYFTRIGVPHPGSVIGTYEVELETLEYKPPKATAGSGTPTKDVKRWEGSGNGYPPKQTSAANKPSKVNTGPAGSAKKTPPATRGRS